MIRVALVNDLRIALVALRHIVQSMPDAEVAWTAMDGQEAVDRCAADQPDVLLMDMRMPGMDGVEATRRIMQNSPCPIVVVTATIEGNASLVYEALGHGALDAVATPVLGRDGDLSGGETLARKIRAVDRLAGSDTFAHKLHGADRGTGSPPAPTPPVFTAAPRGAGGPPPIIAIGASTGGPEALRRVLASLPRPLAAAIVIVQHVDPEFAGGLASWLTDATGHDVRIAAPGDCLEADRAWIASTSDHMVVSSGGVLRYQPEPRELAFRPSADVFFESLRTNAQSLHGVAVLLTGMGRDGAQGLLDLRSAGWHTIAQDQATSVVWGMPGAAVQLEAACAVEPIDSIGPSIIRALAHPPRRTSGA